MLRKFQSCWFVLVCIISSLSASRSHAGIIILDLIDDVFATGGSQPFAGAGDYDIFSTANGMLSRGPDGVSDVRILVTANNSGSQNGVTFEISADANTTGIRSRIRSEGAPDTNNPGTVNSQVIEIRFLNPSIQISADATLLASLSSANTINSSADTNAWESSVLQLLDSDFQPFSPFVSRDYVDDQEARGVTGIGTLVADGDTQDDVGTANAASDNSGGENLDRPKLDFDNALLAEGTRIGGLRFTHILTDTRGTADTGGFNYTATINEFNVSASFSAVPEPSSLVLLSVGTLCVTALRRKRFSGTES